MERGIGNETHMGEKERCLQERRERERNRKRGEGVEDESTNTKVERGEEE